MVNIVATAPMPLSAEEAYILHHAKAVALLGQLKEVLFDMPAPDGEISIDWSHVGTVAEAERQLTQVLAFVRAT